MALSLAVSMIVTMAAGASPALAGEAHPIIEHTGFETDTFANPNGIAVDESTGDVYVADLGTDTVSKFDASGNRLTSRAAQDAQRYVKGNELDCHARQSFAFPLSAHDTPAAIAVDNSTASSDPSAGDLYVMDAGHGVIDKFSPGGEYLSQIAGFVPAPGSGEHELLGLGVDASGIVRAELSANESRRSRDRRVRRLVREPRRR